MLTIIIRSAAIQRPVQVPVLLRPLKRKNQKVNKHVMLHLFLLTALIYYVNNKFYNIRKLTAISSLCNVFYNLYELLRHTIHK